MNSLVVYFSRGGKTGKVANAIAQELRCRAVDITQETPDSSGVDMLVVGSGNYGGNTDRKLVNFVNARASFAPPCTVQEFVTDTLIVASDLYHHILTRTRVIFLLIR